VDDRPIASGLSFQEGVLIRVSQQHRETTVVTYNSQSGAELNALNAETAARVVLRRIHVHSARTTGRLTFIDLRKMAVLWRKDISVERRTPRWNSRRKACCGWRAAAAHARVVSVSTLQRETMHNGQRAISYIPTGANTSSLSAVTRFHAHKPSNSAAIWTTKVTQRPWAIFFLRAYTAGAFSTACSFARSTTRIAADFCARWRGTEACR
jgi:hypothetical protein